MLRVAARRFLAVLIGVAAGTAAISLALGALFSASALRSISLGLYLVGSFLLVGGFVTGNRVRGDREPLGRRGETRRTTSAMRQEAVEASSAFIAIGIVLVVLGIVADRRVALF
jgi:uncharacterized membrane protein HdeD (DUF308 family)